MKINELKRLTKHGALQPLALESVKGGNKVNTLKNMNIVIYLYLIEIGYRIVHESKERFKERIKGSYNWFRDSLFLG